MPIRRLVFCCRSNTIDSERVNARGEMRLEDLPEELATEIRAIQRRYREELEASDSKQIILRYTTSEGRERKLNTRVPWEDMQNATGILIMLQPKAVDF